MRQIQILVLSEDARSGGAGRRTQLQRPLELKARAAECGCCQLFYMDESYEVATKLQNIYEHRLVLSLEFVTYLRNHTCPDAELVFKARESKG